MINASGQLDNKYVVMRRLGVGAFGEVFLANDATAGRQVAIKVLSRQETDDHSDLIQEMRTLAQFSHPHVVAFYQHFTDANRLYLVMEFCPGGSLYDLLYTTSGLTVEEALKWGIELCETLAFVHEKGVVHHDIKPSNILFTADGTIKLGDFGVANRNMGTLLYLAPEMLLGEQVSPTDPRIDIYALGLTILEMLTGWHPLDGLAYGESLQRRIAHDFVANDLPRWVQEVLLKATHPTPELRFQTAGDFAEALRIRYVPYVFDSNRIRAHALAEKAEAAIKRRKWRLAQVLVMQALDLSPDCVSALVAAGRFQLLVRRIDRAREYFTRAIAINPRIQVQKELGWLYLENDRLLMAISLLTDHLQRNGSDYEAYNLLLKCFYLTERYEAGDELAANLIKERAPNDCFRANQFLCRVLSGELTENQLGTADTRVGSNPFIAYNLRVATERPRAWGDRTLPEPKSKLLFEEFRFGSDALARRKNLLAINSGSPARFETGNHIVTIGSLSSNDIVLSDSSVSRRHCVIVNYPGDVWLYDLGSTMGTLFGGQRLEGRVLLDGVHDVTVGRVVIRVAAEAGLLI